ncbi:MAG TPA: macro domain-containing protein [Candidatus Sphingobacterium stercoripullorum]|uniref:Macro domain-containing protein n=1 Tax=Candidatus Sphingobacterium stercoripullorum TaxID=2838759 RepID=A0A9D1W7B4_9SPHI|nr:macro domain-containing protein [Candidatus Sphingobacterium stercoripullorum]
MIRYIKGNLLESKAQALVNTVNTVGVMGKGIALQFKKQYPNNFKSYARACKNNEIKIGKLFITEESSLLTGNKTIINFPTKTTWKLPSKYEYIEKGLLALVQAINQKGIKSIAIPALGAGNGGLKWSEVKQLISKHLSEIDCEVWVYEPNNSIKERPSKTQVKLTPARAMLLTVLFDLVHHGEFVSEFAAEKAAYFLQRFGGQDVFNLNFQPNFYGPYSGKVKYVLYHLNGSYIIEYGSMDKKPFEEIHLLTQKEEYIKDYLNKPENELYKNIAIKTKNFLKGFYSPYGLELLSTIDFIIVTKKTTKLEEIITELEGWSDRKKSLFTNKKFIQIALNNILEHDLDGSQPEILQTPQT